MALLLPASFEISFKRFNGDFPAHHVRIPPIQTKFRIGAQQQGQFSPQKNNKMSPSVKRAFEKAQEYKKKKEAAQQSAQNQNQNDGPKSPSSQPEKGDAVFDAFERAKAYKCQQGEKNPTKEDDAVHKQGETDCAKEDNAVHKQGETDYAKEDNMVEVEIITRDGIIKRKYTPTNQDFYNIKDYSKKGISSIDFLGLDFSDKKPKQGLPVGLNVGFQSPPSGPLPEVELIVGDVSKFGVKTLAKDNDISDLYKPKVSSWGVFPRPNNISKTYGGGKVIQPGDVLENKDEKEAREARTKKLIDAYREKLGEIVDPKVKAMCEKVLKEGNDLMEVGKLQDAIVYYERIMNEMVFKSELHGLAALQWSICLDSLNRSNEARVMYEKLSSHPNLAIRKKAKQLVFGFQAMKMMKISGSYTLDTSGYQKYFEAFTDGYNNAYYPTEEKKMEDQMLGQTLPYLIFLLFPIVLVFTAAAYKIH